MDRINEDGVCRRLSGIASVTSHRWSQSKAAAAKAKVFSVDPRQAHAQIEQEP